MALSTLVVGGGIGGLSLARELARRKLPVTVLERARRVDPVGAGIIMNPNAMRVLERNGLADAVRANSWPYLRRETRDRHGRVLAERDYRPLYDAGKLAVGALVHRAHLHDVLFGGIEKGVVRFGTAVEKIRVSSRRVQAVAGGQVLEADVLVGADGIHSTVRRHLSGEVAPVYMGYRSHRVVVDNAAGVDCFTELLGRGQRIGLVPIAPGRIYIWTTFNSGRNAAPVLKSADEFRAMFAQFTDPRVVKLFAQLRSADEIITTAVEELCEERWYAGRVALLGDAVHAMTPNIGQGAGMAMEDAAVLAEELAGGGAVEDCFRRYSEKRKPRVETIVRVSRQVGEEGQLSGIIGCWRRNRRVARAGRDAAKAQADLERLLTY
ncbi:MAG TPA: FAD-dependent oxidoreductase [Burkholderiales bacterium]|jgi:2-polyprenyl-6-methoxyphenol hydroxylase-like FAD-dependent oxidoreductase